LSNAPGELVAAFRLAVLVLFPALTL